MANIRHSIVIAVPPERVFPLVSSARGLAQWWAADVTEPGGGAAELGFFKRATIYRLRPTRISPPKTAEWLCETGKEWEGTKLLFDLSSSEGRTLVRFTHADWQEETEYFVSCTTVWGELMFRLKATAEGKSPGPLFTADGLAY